ncbi:Alpha-D-kanosaminyltransferase [Rubripirellula lacrimiformis]|uniref:Alpha-D-kanosaminyltransferase n=1 Tax=Rubripirellula lacrimiformis TaxID=1930273 RepID=A0A517N945_9BACT|nr:glycosyltransferase family 4 protein [Rubripirellula lacrimiformis]QDT03518.1 Alpha-D-kanosaminyltransferase [Rubripirellula lacrimiformis]
MNDRAKIKILHVQLFPMLSGVQRVTLEELRRLDPNIYDRHLLTCEPGPLTDAAQQMGVTCHSESRLIRSLSPLNDYKAYCGLRDLMRKHRFDIVHTHSSKTGVLGRLAAAAAGVPHVVHTVHGFAFPAARRAAVRRFYQWCERRCGKVTDALVCLNPNDRQIAIDDLGIDPRRVHLIPNGVDTTQFKPHSDADLRHRLRRETLPGDAGLPVVMMVGRLWNQKNPLAFVQAAIEILGRGVRAEFYLVGEGDLRPRLEQEIAAAGCGDRIHLLGWRDDVAALLPLADVMVLPSLWEGMPLVLLESQSSAVPVVASNIPGNRECVNDGVDGYLVPPRDIVELAQRIGELIQDDELRRRMGATAREKVIAQFDIRQRFATMTDIYAQMMGRAQAARTPVLGDLASDTAHSHASSAAR